MNPNPRRDIDTALGCLLLLVLSLIFWTLLFLFIREALS